MSTTKGYAKLSSFMVRERYAIYRQFEELACQDLLYRQSELVYLEKELHDIAKRDRDTGREGEEKLYSVDWRRLSTSAQRGSQSSQWAKALEIREKLRDYYETLLRCKSIDGLSRPKQKDISLLRKWIVRLDLGGGCGFIGRDLGPLYPKVYDNQFKGDLILIGDREGEDDALTRLLTGPVFYAFDWLVRQFKSSRSNDVENQASDGALSTNLLHYSDQHIRWAIDFFGTLIATIAPMTSIITLYWIQDMSIRLGVICVFTFVFAAIVKLATRARRVEVFAITAAFCSVQVVFVGSIATAYRNS